MENDSIENCATIGGGFIQTDASDYACVSVLFQLVDKREKDVAYFPKKITMAQNNYSLKWLFALKNPPGRLARWVIECNINQVV